MCLESFFFFNDTATTEIYTLSLHDALPIDRGVDAVARKQPREPRERGHRGREGHRRRSRLGARPRVELDVRPAREVVVGAVGERDDEGPGALLGELVHEAHDLGALPGLAHDDGEGPRVQDRPAEVQHLRGVDQQRRDTAGGQVVHRRVAGVVGAAHAGEHDRPSRLARLPDPFELVALVHQGRGRPSHRVGLTGDLAEEAIGQAFERSHDLESTAVAETGAVESARPVCGSKKWNLRGSIDSRIGVPGPLEVRGSTRAQKTARSSASSGISPSPSCSDAASVSSVSTGAASTRNRTLTSDPRSSVTSAMTVMVGRLDPDQTAASSRSAGRIPRITSPPWMPVRSRSPGTGISNPANLTTPSPTAAPTRFMGGEPMNAATNRFAGCWYRRCGVSTCCSTPSRRTATRSPSVIAST